MQGYNFKANWNTKLFTSLLLTLARFRHKVLLCIIVLNFSSLDRSVIPALNKPRIETTWWDRALNIPGHADVEFKRGKDRHENASIPLQKGQIVKKREVIEQTQKESFKIRAFKWQNICQVIVFQTNVSNAGVTYI